MSKVSSPDVSAAESAAASGKQSRSGPGWLLSAYTLGSGTAIGSLWAGSKYGYDLLWVQPLAMLMGVIILSGAAYFTLQSEKSPYERFKTELHPSLAITWALASLAASVIWHLPQYGLAFASLKALIGFEETALTQILVGGVILGISTAVTWSYAKKGGLFFYELMIKFLVWMTIVCLAIVLIKSQVPWGEVGKGMSSFRIPEGSGTIIFGLLGAAVGINMTFLYPYSIRSKGWGKADAKFAVRDLIVGMFIPFIICTGMMVVAAAVHMHAKGVVLDKTAGDIPRMAQVFIPIFGNQLGSLLFYIGILAMPLGTITLHMLTSGFILSEMMGKSQFSSTWKIGTLLPAIGVIGVAIPLKGWLPVATSAVCLMFLPIAYIGFLLLFKKEAYKPGAVRIPARTAVFGLMIAVIGVVTISAGLEAVDTVQFFAGLFK